MSCTGLVGTSPASGTAPVYPAPVAAFTADNFNPFEGQTVSFTDQSTNSPTAWLWKINGDPFSIAQNPTYYFSAANLYSISLTATNMGGSDTVVHTVNVQPSI